MLVASPPGGAEADHSPNPNHERSDRHGHLRNAGHRNQRARNEYYHAADVRQRFVRERDCGTGADARSGRAAGLRSLVDCKQNCPALRAASLREQDLVRLIQCGCAARGTVQAQFSDEASAPFACACGRPNKQRRRDGHRARRQGERNVERREGQQGERPREKEHSGKKRRRLAPINGLLEFVASSQELRLRRRHVGHVKQVEVVPL